MFICQMPEFNRPIAYFDTKHTSYKEVLSVHDQEIHISVFAENIHLSLKNVNYTPNEKTEPNQKLKFQF